MRPEVLDYELLVKAKQVIRKEKNWMQESYHQGDAYCAVGALLVAKGEAVPDDIPQSVIDSLERKRTNTYKLLQEAVPDGFEGSVEDFNDDCRTTHNMIMRLFDRAIAKAKALATAPFHK